MWTVKAILVSCLLAGLLFPGIPGVEGKGWMERCFGYPISALVIPIFWYFSKRRSNYPHLADALLVSPFALDLLGNLLNLFDTVNLFDDALHFVNWMFLVSAFVLLLDRKKLPLWNVVLLGAGVGAITIISWEAVEWIIQEMGTTGLELTYDDTIGDLVLSTAGGTLGAFIASKSLAE
ncbi:uncharacterized protein METZ01_LOCUS301191 [marine metagenome]|uniref:VanZ-like domain-containing protein n=1 Tax=marine metagenome TaxID=408172 RepID=A0A382MKN8_9ZZZZ|tara:strand:- start:86 stop:619 length:534 start_codon:yes stop_codon:yes gene_type:complete